MRKITLRYVAILCCGAALSACSGRDRAGGDDTLLPSADTHAVHGVAAIGTPITGANVALSCADGSTAATGTDSDGSWTVDVPDTALPCAVKLSSGTIGDAHNSATFYSLATASGDDAVTNITPLTDLVLARALLAATGNGDLDAWFADPTATLANVATGLVAASDALAATLNAAGYTVPNDFAPFGAAFTPAAGDAYDDLLEALAAALAEDADVHGYATLRDSFASGGSVPAVPQEPNPPNPPTSTPLPDETLGVSFDDASTAHLWLQPEGQGGITAIDGNGDGRVGVSIGDRTDNGPDGTVAFHNLPDTLGTHACGDAVGSGTLQMEVTFNGITNPRKTYISYAESADPDQRTLLPGYRCSVTLTHVGSFTSQYIYGDDYIEGTFTAKLRQEAADCAGEGNCSPYKDIVISNGKFRINKSGHYMAPPPPPTETGAGILGTYLKNVLAGDYTLKCSESPGQAATSFAFTIKADGSSTFQNEPLVDATHPGQIKVDGAMASSSAMTVKFAPSAAHSAYVVLGFKPDGTFYPNSVHTAGTSGKTLFCYSNTGHTAPAASAQAYAALGNAIATLARSQTLNCEQASATEARSFSINSDGSAQVGSESFAANTLNTVIDDYLFGTSNSGRAEFADTVISGGTVTSRSLQVALKADRATAQVLVGTGLGPDDVSDCRP